MHKNHVGIEKKKMHGPHPPVQLGRVGLGHLYIFRKRKSFLGGSNAQPGVWEHLGYFRRHGFVKRNQGAASKNRENVNCSGVWEPY